MLGSQALETAIGLAVMFFILATAASVITETISRLFTKRAKDLERSILEMLTRPAPDERETKRTARSGRLAEGAAFLTLFKETSVWQAAEAVSGRTLWTRRKVGNSYLSAKSFADAIHEVLTSPARSRDLEQFTTILDGVPSLKKRLTALMTDSHSSMVDLKAGLETWFDESMARAAGAYKRWASLVLFLVGLFLAIAGNASTTDVARDLWQNSATRAAVAEAAGNVGENPGDIRGVADVTEQLTALHLPVGWDVTGSDEARSDNPVDFVSDSSPAVVLMTSLGWLLTGLLVMLGGPFWYDLLSRLVTLRSTGSKPPPAVEDEASATRAVTGGGSRDAGRAVGGAPELDRIRSLLGLASEAVTEETVAQPGRRARWSLPFRR